MTSKISNLGLLIKLFIASYLLICGITIAEEFSQPISPDRTQGEGPFNRLILRGGILIAGNGAPAIGPVDIVIEKNKIVSIHNVGNPGVPINPNRRPKAKAGDKEIDVAGQYLLPGFIDMHAHIGGSDQGTTPEYVFKLWMAHGITSIREPGSFNGLDWVLHHKKRSAKNEITAPRITAYLGFGMNPISSENEENKAISTAEDAQKWVKKISKAGAEGIKFFGARPDIMAAALQEANKQGIGSAMHHAQLNVGWMNVLDSARLGLNTMEHWYGLPEALFEGQTLQNYPVDYNYNNEQHRFEEAGKLWAQAAKQGSEHWNSVRDELLSLDFTINPTFTIYEASRDLTRARRDEWHELYTLPKLWDFFQPSRNAHGSYWFNWGTEQEIAWKENYRLWMAFINDYKNHGGRVTTGSDSGYIYKLYGFGYISELELLREAGFHPLEVIRAATLSGAEALGLEDKVGSIEVGKYADILVVNENPLKNLKVLYGTGAVMLDENNKAVRSKGIIYTIKDGIIYDSKALLKDVEKMVAKSRKEQGIKGIVQPGMTQ
ncbi:MAG: cytosine/adenosine deaminase-related metal-dependent hydrolase [Enterobacterales bacterium]|jgi:cytosine/adenosine deaminase-related metal-dependent hydrolase